jgi:hypothetical protein
MGSALVIDSGGNLISLLLTATSKKKSPSDGQGRVAHRRGSRFYTTILRVVTTLNTPVFGKLRAAKNCFGNLIMMLCRCKSKFKMGLRFLVPKAG